VPLSFAICFINFENAWISALSLLGSFIPGRKPKLWIKNLTNSLSYFFPGVVRDKRRKPRGSVHESLALDLEAAGEVHDANRCLTTRAAKSPNRWL